MKPFMGRIKTHWLKIGAESNVWSIENVLNLLHDMCFKGFTELVNNTYKIKQTQEGTLVEETLAELTSQYATFSESKTLVTPETQKSSESLFLWKGTVTQIEKAMINDCLRISKLSWKFHIPAIYNFVVIHPWNLRFYWKKPCFLAVSIASSVYKQNFTTQ